ncbi:uracil-DNA glycosylase [Ammoniphilus sp. YIM 78166]|uniref:uracil-DNA glycosylase n=1 Tax=Ammoniphilus sp. YIM 78166 TaxID=1644106 RepID=UPI00106FA432|nr:uracil-DNA glycosylase [Ammoniphilus sp. YIM 78166]
MDRFYNDWASLLHKEFNQPYYLQLEQFVTQEYQSHTVYPPCSDIFNALHYTGYQNTKVVILGQDPYHGEGQAHGLSFSVKAGTPLPPSLKNIFKELTTDLGCPYPRQGSLEEWARQGVLLLNTVLTVRAGEAHSHKGKGWETFTDTIISLLNDRQDPIIFILWGKPAQAKAKLITAPHHAILMSAHPSPLSASRGFLGSRPFSKANAILRKWGGDPVNWEL